MSDEPAIPYEQPSAEGLAAEAPAATAPGPPAEAPELAYEEPAGWDDEEPELPPRPRRRLLTPLPVALLCVLLTACGFIAGVLVQKGQGSSGSSSSAAAGFASRLSALRGGTSTSGTSTSSGTGTRGGGAASLFGGAGGATAGEVTFVQGDTLYVSTSEGNTVKVLAPAGTTVTKSVSSDTKSIHPGETVVVTGTKGSSGVVTAESIRVGGTSGGGIASLFGGGSGTGASSTSGSASSGSSSSSSTAGGGGPALFGP